MKKKRLISLIAAFSLVFTGVTAYVPSGVYAEENVQMELPQKQFSEFCRYEELGSCIREQQGF